MGEAKLTLLEAHSRFLKEDPPPQFRKVDLPHLTARQKQVAYLITLGLSTKAMASELFLAEGSVAGVISDLFAATGVKTRSELAIAVRENPELLYVSEVPPLCLIGWLKQQRLKAAMAISDAIDRTEDEQLIDDLYKILELLQPNEKNQFEQGLKKNG